MIEKFTAALLVLLWLPIAYGCADADEPQMVSAVCYDVVELVETSAQSTVFGLYPADNCGDPVLLTSKAPVDVAGKPVGTFFMLEYVALNNKVNTSTEIAVSGCAAINNFKAEIKKPAEIAGWNRQEVYLYSLWQAGNSVILDLALIFDSQGREFGIVADKTTMSSDKPQLYLVNRPRLNRPNFMRRYFIASDLTKIWEGTEAQTLQLHIHNSNLTDATVFTLRRPTNQILP